MASPESSLEQGLAALQQGDYKNAIAHLEAVCQTENQSACQFKACQGLVVAYQHSGNIAKAIAVCETLINSSNPQVQLWAGNQLELALNTANELTEFLSFNPNKKHQIKKHSTGVATSENPHPQWRQAGRAKKWQLLPKVNLFPLLLLEIGTVIALFWLIRALVQLGMTFTNTALVKLPYLQPLQLFYRDPTPIILLILGIFLGLSPWLLDRLLGRFYDLQPLSINTLSSYSSETVRVLNRYCRQKHWSLPKLFILPTLAPVALTYGLPRTARIVVSQGLLEQLTDDEIATIYASQLGHITHWDFVVMSLVMLVTQLPYLVYWQISKWGDKVTNQILQTIAAAIACVAYGIWYILSAVSTWLSQLRIYYSDRLATEITGNPNGLTTALLKITKGIANDIQQQGHTSWLLESFNFLTIIGYQQAITLGSLPATTQFESVLAWDCLNPHRYWLNINNTHPLIGDRLQRLAQIAVTWHLETPLNLPKPRNRDSVSLHPLLLQAAPFLGIFLGFAFGVLSWVLGGIGILFNSSQLAWMFGDWVIIKGCLPIGFSIGTLIRINAFFPDIKPATLPSQPVLPYLLANPTALPVNTQSIRLQGELLARSGISNYLGQDFILSSPSGLVKLHHIPLFDLARIKSEQPLSLKNLGNKALIATGWFRRGATTWIDIDTLHTQGKASYSNHPLWSTLLASAAAIWGVYIIWQGEF